LRARAGKWRWPVAVERSSFIGAYQPGRDEKSFEILRLSPEQEPFYGANNITGDVQARTGE
jgi:hypothetical protein